MYRKTDINLAESRICDMLSIDNNIELLAIKCRYNLLFFTLIAPQ